MALLSEAVIGNVSGKVGNVVFVKYKNKTVIRSAPVRTKKSPTQKQILRRDKFALANSLASKFKTFFSRIKSRSSEAEPRKDFFGRVFLAISESPNGLVVDYSKLEFSRGLLEPVKNFSIKEIGNTLHLSWNEEVDNGLHADVLVFAFAAEQGLFNQFLPIVMSAKLKEANMIMPVHSLWKGRPVHVYIFKQNEMGKLSDTSYACTSLTSSQFCIS